MAIAPRTFSEMRGFAPKRRGNDSGSRTGIQTIRVRRGRDAVTPGSALSMRKPNP
jgi:hypothetical protein